MVTYSLDAVGIITLLVSIVLPALVALVTQRLTSPGIKALTLLGLAVVTGFLSELASSLSTGSSYDLDAALLNWLAVFLIGALTHYGLLKPLNITGTNGVIAKAAPGGIGAVAPVKEPDPRPGPHVVVPQKPGFADHAAPDANE